MIKKELDSGINPYLFDDDTHYKLNHSHYVLGQNDLRELQNKAKERRKAREKMIDELGVRDLIKPSTNNKQEQVKINLYYLEHKEAIDQAFDEALKVLTKEELVQYAKNINIKKS